MIKSILISIIIFITIVQSACAHAETHGFLGLSIGYYNVLNNEHNSIVMRAEYKPQTSVIFKKLKPWFGIQATTNASIWGGAGLLLEFNPVKNIVITPSVGVGFYAYGKGDVNLSHPIQFTSQIEMAYTLKNDNRIALAFSHMSHGGLGGNNPGSETLALHYYIPTEKMF